MSGNVVSGSQHYPGWGGYPPGIPGPGPVVWPGAIPAYVPRPETRRNPFPTRPAELDVPKSGYNGALIVTILDESTSMDSARDSTISAYNEFIQGQQSLRTRLVDGHKASASLLKFGDSRVERVYRNVPLVNVEPLSRTTYRPYGGTNLFDAIGSAMMDVRSILQEVSEDQRPAVIVMIITDGEENTSRTYTRQDVLELVKAAEKADWTFMFLGANIDAFAVGSSFGMNAHNTLQYNTSNMAGTMDAVGSAMSAVRSAKAAGVATETLYAYDMYEGKRDKAL